MSRDTQSQDDPAAGGGTGPGVQRESHFWTTSIRLIWFVPDDRHPNGAWGATLSFCSADLRDAHADGVVRSQGTLSTLYARPDVSRVIDALIADAWHLGVNLRDPTFYVEGDGEDADVPLPVDWRAILARECARLGWHDVYAETSEGA